jgi:hypothetical protein
MMPSSSANSVNKLDDRTAHLGLRSQVRKIVHAIGVGIFALVFLQITIGPACAQDAKVQYPVLAPMEQYRAVSPSDEIALARSAAPASISSDADVLILGAHGYETAVKGKNGFVCIVERSWATNPDDLEFWNPKIRAPICFNPPSARSILPSYLKRTEWVLAGLSKTQILDRTKSELAANAVPVPELSSMCYMLSKNGYLGDATGHWHPHLMFFFTRTEAVAWGANLPGSPVIALQGDPEPVTLFLVPVLNWSDGTPGPTEMP